MTNPLNPDDLPENILEMCTELASTIMLDIMESDKYEDILDDIVHSVPDVPDIVEAPTEFYNVEAKIARQIWRTLALILLDRHGNEQAVD